MIYDSVLIGKGQKRRGAWTAVVCLLALCVLSALMFWKQSKIELVDFYVHMYYAHDFNFSDLHSITSRIAYPLWHLMVAALYQLGLPLEVAAVSITVMCKGLAYGLCYWLIDSLSGGTVKRWILSLLTLAATTLTGLWIPSVARYVYKGVGSPNVWHNPTQLAVIVSMMVVVPWLLHCWYDFERRIKAGETNITLPWWKVFVLAFVTMGSLSCKPTFMQAFLPSAFVMYLVELIRHKKEWRYFGQIVLGFIPSVCYFLLQYLYYTGVVVEFTSGVEFGVTLETAWVAIRNSLMMSACPLAALIVCWRKGMMKNRSLVLALLMVVFSTLQAMAFRETGLRIGHGNFTWAANSSSFFLWVAMLGVFLRTFPQDIQDGMSAWRKAGYGVTIALFGWHVVSGLYYLWYLFTTGNAF